MPSIADILVQELLSSLKPAIQDAVQRALGGSPKAQEPAPTAPPVSKPKKRIVKLAKAGVYIVATSRGRLPDWLKTAANVDTSSEVTARWPKGTKLLKDAPLPPFSAKWQKALTPKLAAPKGRKKVVAQKAVTKKTVPAVVAATATGT